ncbi:hypothetical protein KI387_025089, partial [Taxus chinensis]
FQAHRFVQAKLREWKQKANELEGVIKALETHLNQVEADYKRNFRKKFLQGRIWR